jgi:hypothetical protein
VEEGVDGEQRAVASPVRLGEACLLGLTFWLAHGTGKDESIILVESLVLATIFFLELTRQFSRALIYSDTFSTRPTTRVHHWGLQTRILSLVTAGRELVTEVADAFEC